MSMNCPPERSKESCISSAGYAVRPDPEREWRASSQLRPSPLHLMVDSDSLKSYHARGRNRYFIDFNALICRRMSYGKDYRN